MEVEVVKMRNENRHQAPAVTINCRPIYFDEDWNFGIGGGLW